LAGSSGISTKKASPNYIPFMTTEEFQPNFYNKTILSNNGEDFEFIGYL